MSGDPYEQTRPDAVSDLRFRPVTMETLRDFDAFRHEHPAMENCSCMRWRMHALVFTCMNGRRRGIAFDALVQRGTPVGILAYHEGTPVGWCSIGPRNSLTGVKGNPPPPGVEVSRTWAVTCFFVDPRLRRQGVSVRLLQAAVEYARSEGAKVVEGYPIESRKNPHSSMGALTTFRRAGFLDVTPHGRKRHIMRNVVR
jgi:GNAT superfamily N-acetyltransferase